MAAPALRAQRRARRAALVGPWPARRVRPDTRAARPPHPPTAVARAPPGRRAVGSAGDPVTDPVRGAPGRVPQPALPARVAALDRRPRRVRGGGVRVHVLPVRVLAP